MSPKDFRDFCGGDDFREGVIFTEASHVLDRQGASLSKEERAILETLILDHLKSVADGVRDKSVQVVGRELGPDEKDGELVVHPDDFLGLFLVETFLNRKHEGK